MSGVQQATTIAGRIEDKSDSAATAEVARQAFGERLAAIKKPAQPWPGAGRQPPARVKDGAIGQHNSLGANEEHEADAPSSAAERHAIAGRGRRHDDGSGPKEADGREKSDATPHRIEKRAKVKPQGPFAGLAGGTELIITALIARIFGPNRQDPVGEPGDPHGMARDSADLVRFYVPGTHTDVVQGTWQQYFNRDPDILRSEALFDSQTGVLVLNDPQGQEVARGYPIIHRHFGIGHEIHPAETVDETAVAGAQDTAIYRVFVNDYNHRTIVRLQPSGIWEIVPSFAGLEATPDPPAHARDEVSPPPAPRPQSESGFMTIFPQIGPATFRNSGSRPDQSPSWRHYFQNNSPASLEVQAAIDGMRRARIIFAGRSGHRLASAAPIHDTRYGSGWEVQPEAIPGSPQEADDTGTYRIFVNHHGAMTVHIRRRDGVWTLLGNALPSLGEEQQYLRSAISNEIPRPPSRRTFRDPYRLNDGSLFTAFPTRNTPRAAAVTGDGQTFRRWQDHFREHSNATLLAAAKRDAAEQRSVVILNGTDDAEGLPIHHERFGWGWEILPQSSADAPASDDTAIHRIFIGQDNRMTVFRQSPEGDWASVNPGRFQAAPGASEVGPTPARSTSKSDLKPSDFQYIAIDRYHMHDDSYIIEHHPAKSRDIYNGPLQYEYTSWRHFLQDPNYTNYRLRDDAATDLEEKQLVRIMDNSGRVLAVGQPIYHPDFGNGWEFLPRPMPNVLDGNQDMAVHRVFIGSTGKMIVFRRGAGFNWIKLGAQVDDFSNNYTDIVSIDYSEAPRAKMIALSNAYEGLIKDLTTTTSASLPNYYRKTLFSDLTGSGFNYLSPLEIVITNDFSTVLKGEDATIYKDSNFIYYDKKLYIDQSSITSTEAGLSTHLNGKTGAEWNKSILHNALDMIAEVEKHGGRLPTLIGDPNENDKIYGRHRGYDYWDKSPIAGPEWQGDPPPSDAAKDAFGYGATSAWGGKFRYGAFSPMIANHQLGVRQPELIPLLQNYGKLLDYGKEQLRDQISTYKSNYNGLSPADVKAIVDYSHGGGTNSVFEAPQTVIDTGEKNLRFLAKMAQQPGAAPVDNRIANNLHERQRTPGQNGAPDLWDEAPFEYQAHRTNYNNAFGIPQNSNAGLLSGYIAGIRSFEFDVLETAGPDGKSGKRKGEEAKGADNEVVVVHDMTTNRTSAKYGLNAPHSIENSTSDAFFKHMQHGSLNPTAASPKLDVVFGTPAGSPAATRAAEVRPQLLKSAIDFVLDHLPKAVVTLDARNDSPVGVAKVLADQRKIRPADENFTTKVYAYTLKAGFGSLAHKYSARYTGDGVKTASDLKKLNIIPALDGGKPEAGADGWTTTLHKGDVLTRVPSRAAGRFLNLHQKSLAAESAYRRLQFAASFAGNAQIAGIQLSSLPSIASEEVAWTTDDSDAELIASGTAVLRTIEDIRQGWLTPESTRIPEMNLADRFNRARLGLSDRFADYYVATRDQSGRVIDGAVKDRLRKFYYNGPTPQARDTYGSRIRSAIGKPDTKTPILRYEPPISFATTNASVDLRAHHLGVLGTGAIPETIRYHPHNVLKDSAVNSDPAGYSPPRWTQGFDRTTDEFVRLRHGRTFNTLLHKLGFQPAHFDRARLNVRSVLRDPHGKNKSSSWFDSWRTNPDFSRFTRSSVEGHQMLKFGDSSIAIPFSKYVGALEGFAGTTLTGWYEISAKRGANIYLIDELGNRSVIIRGPRREGTPNRTVPWTGRTSFIQPPYAGEISNGLHALTDSELMAAVRGDFDD